MSEPDPEQLARELEEQLKALRVEEVLVQSLVTVSSIGFRRVGLSADTREDRDLPQAQMAIDAMEALTPVLEKFLPEQLATDFKGSTSQLKLAFARAVGEDGSEEQQDEAPPPEPAAPEADAPEADAAEPADASGE